MSRMIPTNFLSELEEPLSKPSRHEVLKALVDGDLQRALELCEAELADIINIRFLSGLAQDLRGRRAWTENQAAAEADFKDAISAYSDVIEDTTSHFLSRAYVRRSQLHLALGYPEAALKGLDELDELHLLGADEPLKIYSYLSRGIAELKRENYERAGRAFEAVLSLDPQNIRALDGDGQAYLYTEHWQKALERFQVGLEIVQKKKVTEKIAHFMFKIALTNYLDDKYDQAIEELQALEPILRELQDSERRQLHQKIDILREFLRVSKIPLKVPDSEKEFKEQHQLFETSAEKAVKFITLFACHLYLLRRTPVYHAETA